MLKTKYLHRRSRSEKSDAFWKTKKYWRIKNINMFSDLPFHQSIKKGYFNYDTSPLGKFIESKIGQNWNDVYSEILTKIKKNYRHNIDNYLYRWFGLVPIYDVNFIPRTTRGRIMFDVIYIEGDILVKKSEQQIISDAKRYQTNFFRREKLIKILKNRDIEFDQKKYEEYLKMDGEMRMKKWKRN